MTRLLWTRSLVFAMLPGLLVSRVQAQFAAAVVSYDAGVTPTSGFTTASAAIGEPERFTGEGAFPGVVSPFNPPFLPNEIVSVGEGGQITLRLSHYAIPQAAGPEIGVFENVGIVDIDFPNGQAGTPAGTFGPLDSAVVEVSANGTSWVSLGGVTFDVPTNGYTDLTNPFSSVPGSTPSDFQQPFTGGLSSFDGLRYFDASGPDMLELLAGSGGGTWLDISGTGLAHVGFIRFSLADDFDANTRLNFELDAVSITHAAVGAAVVPEPTTMMPALVALVSIDLSRRLRSRLRSRAWMRQDIIGAKPARQRDGLDEVIRGPNIQILGNYLTAAEIGLHDRHANSDCHRDTEQDSQSRQPMQRNTPNYDTCHGNRYRAANDHSVVLQDVIA